MTSTPDVTSPDLTSPRNSRATIISIGIIAIALSSLAHEGLGHGLVAYLRGDIPTELTSNHLSDVRADRLVDAGGTLVNLALGILVMFAARALSARPNLRYFLTIFAAFNLLDASGYFLFSGILGLGDWQAFLLGLPHYAVLRIVMTLGGAGFYFLSVRAIAHALAPFCPTRDLYNTIGRLPYYAACLFYCLAGAFDPLGIQLLFLSTIPAAFGGLSGMMWADSLMPSTPATSTLTVHRQPAWWTAAIVLGLAYIIFLGRGIQLHHS